MILCERGERTFASHTRNTLDLSRCLMSARRAICGDRGPEPCGGRRAQVIPLSRAAVAVDATG